MVYMDENEQQSLGSASYDDDDGTQLEQTGTFGIQGLSIVEDVAAGEITQEKDVEAETSKTISPPTIPEHIEKKFNRSMYKFRSVVEYENLLQKKIHRGRSRELLISSGSKQNELTESKRTGETSMAKAALLIEDQSPQDRM